MYPAVEDTISVVAVRMLLAELRRRGLPTGALGVGRLAHPGFLADMRSTISLREFDNALRVAKRLANEEGLGLSVGLHASASTFQLPAQLALMTRTLQDAFDMLNRFLPLLVGGVTMSLERRGERARVHLHMACVRESEVSTRFLVEVLASALCRFALHFAPRLQLHRLALNYPAPAYAGRYETVFGCAPEFATSAIFAEFDADVLSAEQELTDLPLLSMLEVEAEKMLEARSGEPNLAERVRNVLRCKRDLGAVKAKSLSEDMGVSWRRLRAMLRDQEHVTLSELLDEVRLEVASEELRRSDLSIKQVADRLGYSEQSAFHRAFKRWTGMTPGEFASQQKVRGAQS